MEVSLCSGVVALLKNRSGALEEILPVEILSENRQRRSFVRLPRRQTPLQKLLEPCWAYTLLALEAYSRSMPERNRRASRMMADAAGQRQQKGRQRGGRGQRKPAAKPFLNEAPLHNSTAFCAKCNRLFERDPEADPALAGL